MDYPVRGMSKPDYDNSYRIISLSDDFGPFEPLLDIDIVASPGGTCHSTPSSSVEHHYPHPPLDPESIPPSTQTASLRPDPSEANPQIQMTESDIHPIQHAYSMVRDLLPGTYSDAATHSNSRPMLCWPRCTIPANTSKRPPNNLLDSGPSLKRRSSPNLQDQNSDSQNRSTII